MVYIYRTAIRALGILAAASPLFALPVSDRSTNLYQARDTPGLETDLEVREPFGILLGIKAAVKGAELAYKVGKRIYDSRHHKRELEWEE